MVALNASISFFQSPCLSFIFFSSFWQNQLVLFSLTFFFWCSNFLRHSFVSTSPSCSFAEYAVRNAFPNFLQLLSLSYFYFLNFILCFLYHIGLQAVYLVLYFFLKTNSFSFLLSLSLYLAICSFMSLNALYFLIFSRSAFWNMTSWRLSTKYIFESYILSQFLCFAQYYLCFFESPSLILLLFL